MSNEYVTNPSVRAFLAKNIKYDLDHLHRMEASTRKFWQPLYDERIQGYHLMAISLQGALQRGELKVG